MLDHTDPLHRTENCSTIDSEHNFRYLMSLFLHHPERGLLETVRYGLRRVLVWPAEVDPAARVGLNIILAGGAHLVGSRYDRSLFTLHRDRVFTCSIGGKSHVHHDLKTPYRSVEVASGSATSEDNWKQVPNKTVFCVDDGYFLETLPL